MSKKTKTSSVTDSTGHVVQTPTNPEWVSGGLGQIGGQILDLSKADPYSFSAGPDALQLRAGEGAAGLNPRPWLLNGAVEATGRVMNANAPQIGSSARALPFINDYMNPYTDSVVKSSLAGFDQNAGLTRNQQLLDLAGDSTFGGSGGSILRALTEGQLSLSRGQLESGLRSQGFETALGAANSDAGREQSTKEANLAARSQQMDRALQAAGQLVGLNNAYDANQRENIGTQADIGDALQKIAQAKATSPLALLGAETSMFSGLPLGLLHGQIGDSTEHTTSSGTSKTSDPLGSLSALLGGGGALMQGLGAMGVTFSDERLKRDIVKVGERPDGLGLYLFRYLWSPVRYLGVMAQEVLKVKPEAVLRHPSGFLMVDYGAL